MREIGYYWGLNHKTDNSIDKWGIFWNEGVDFSECSFVRIDSTEISNIEK